MDKKNEKKLNACTQTPVDNFSTYRNYAKGFISYRVDDPNKMRDYETLRGYFSKNNIAYISSRLRLLAIGMSHKYGNEREVLRTIFRKKLARITSWPGAFILGICIIGFELAVRLLRIITIKIPLDSRGPYESIFIGKSHCMVFDSKKYVDINFKDIWRPSIICMPGERIEALIKKSGASEARIGFALLENADPGVFSGNWCVNIKYTLKSISHYTENSFIVPINHETDDMEHNRYSLWLDFKIELDDFQDEDITFTLRAEYQPASNTKPVRMPIKTPAIAWGSPRVVKNKAASQTRKVLVLSLETMTDPWFISESYRISVDHLFAFLNDGKWKKFRRSYAQSDGTLGSAGSFLTGLTPLQHGLFDYGSPYYTKYSKSWHPDILTLAQMVKKAEFLTYGVGVKAFSGYIGCARGFDSYFSCYSLHELDCADFDWFSQTWNNVVNNDALIFMHFDRLHKPYAKWHRRINQTYSVGDLTNKLTPLEKYIRQMQELDIQLKRIIDFLKSANQYDNTMIVCVGDHGGAYFWKKRLAYDLYEDRVRVPLWLKEADWSNSSSMDVNHPINATTFPFISILERLGISLPDYFKKLSHLQPEFEGIALSETATHPTEQDYVLSLTDKTHKYIRFVKVDWARNVILRTEKELLQPYTHTCSDHGLKTNCSDSEPKKFKDMKALADMHIESSFEFRRRYSMIS